MKAARFAEPLNSRMTFATSHATMFPGGVHTMDETVSAAPKTAAEYRAVIEAMLAEMQRMHERSEETWSQIERLKAESRAIRAQTDRTLDRVDARLNALEALL